MTNIKTNIESVMNHKSVLLNMGQTTVAPWPHKDKKLLTLKIQLILATFGPLIPKLCSDKSESGGK